MIIDDIMQGIENTLEFGLNELFEDFDTVNREELEQYLKTSVERMREWLAPMLKAKGE